MRYTTASLVGAFVVLLGVGAGCHNDDDGPNIGIAGRTFNQLENCSQTDENSPAHCAFSNGATVVQFSNLGGGNWEAVYVPDSGFRAVGTFSGNTFHFSATSAAGYTEQGSMTFNGNGDAYSGSSTYAANDDSFIGECRFNGAIVPSIPPNAAPIGACP